MAHILFVTSEVYGRRRASVEFARRLLEAGHRVTCAGPENASTDHSVPVVALARPGRAPRRSRLRRIAALPAVRRRRVEAAEALGMPAFVDFLRDTAPDLVVLDAEMHAHVITAAATDVPVAVSTTFFATWKRPGIPPLHRFIVPVPGVASRAAIELAWVRFRLWKGARRRVRWLRGAGLDTESMFRTLARQVGFDFDREVERWDWPLPFSYRALPLLCLQAREFDLPHEPPLHVRYVGPMLPPSGGDEPTDAVPADRGRPLVYVSFGTYYEGDDSAFVRRVLAALSARPDWDVVVGLGGRAAPETLGSVGDNVTVLPWAPQRAWLDRADVAVVHAGASTLNECVITHTPPLVYPLDTNDQFGNAARVAFHRIGRVGDREADGETDITDHVETLLADDELRARLAAMRDRCRRYDAEQAGVRAIEELLAGAD